MPVSVAAGPTQRRGLRLGVRGLLAVLILLVLIPFLTLQAVDVAQRHRHDVQQELQTSTALAETIGVTLAQFLDNIWDMEAAVGLAATQDSDDLMPLLEAVLAYHPALSFVGWVDASGRVVASTEPAVLGLPLGEDPHFARLLAGQDRVVSDLTTPAGLNTPLFLAVQAVRREGVLRGAVLAAVEPLNLGEVLALSPDGRRMVGVADSQGTIVYRTLTPEIARQQQRLAGNGPALPALRAQQAYTSLEFRSSVDGVARMGAAVPIRSLGWVVFVVAPVGTVLAPVWAKTAVDVAVLLLVALASLLAAWKVGSKLVQGIAALEAAAATVARGGLPPPVQVTCPQELAATAQAFQEMATRVQVSMAEAEARTKKWETLFHSVPGMITIFDEDGHQLDMNPAATALLGMPAADFVQMPVGERSAAIFLTYPDGTPVPREEWPITRAMRGERVENFPARLCTRRGEEKDVLVSALPVETVPGRPRRYLSIVQDVTTLRRLEEARTRFLQIAAHELRNPMAGIRGITALIRRRAAVGRALEELPAVLECEVERLGRLMTEILDAFLLHDGRLALRREPVNLTAVAAAAVLPFRAAAEHHRLELAGAAPGDLWVEGDPGRLEQVLRNLVSNAVKYSPDGGEVSVSLSAAGGRALVTVTDQGIGIPADQVERVVEGFYRATNLKDRDPGGLGLGLYVCREIVSRHGGDLKVLSVEGAGTTVVVSLPLLATGMGADPAATPVA